MNRFSFKKIYTVHLNIFFFLASLLVIPLDFLGKARAFSEKEQVLSLDLPSPQNLSHLLCGKNTANLMFFREQNVQLSRGRAGMD